MSVSWERIPIVRLPSKPSDYWPMDSVSKDEHVIKITVEIDGKVEMEFEPLKVDRANGGEFEIQILEKTPEWNPNEICSAPHLAGDTQQRRVWLMMSMGEPVDNGKIYTYRVKDNSDE